MFWPTGAARPAWFHCVVEETRLDAIKTALSVTNGAAPLVFYDGRSSKTVTAQMRMLPERPINVNVGTSANKFYLVTLTDQRFYWYQRRGVVNPPSSWAELFDQIGTLLDVTIATDTIASSYDIPSTKWASGYASISALFDAAATQIGHRVIVALNGDVRTVTWESAQGDSDAYFDTADPVISGGRTSTNGIVRTAPASVVSVFASATDGALGPNPYTVETTLFSLGLSQYGGASGQTGNRETIFADAAYNGLNSTAIATYASGQARDYYGWYLSDADAAWPGIEPFVPTGWEDSIEWTLTIRDDGPFALTRVRRGPWRTFYGGDYSAGYVATLGTPGGGPASIIANVCAQYATGIVITASSYVIDPTFTQLVYIHASAVVAPITITLFGPASRLSTSGLTWADRYVIKKVDATVNAVTVLTASGLVEFATGQSYSSQGQGGTFYHDGTNWYKEP